MCVKRLRLIADRPRIYSTEAPREWPFLSKLTALLSKSPNIREKVFQRLRRGTSGQGSFVGQRGEGEDDGEEMTGRPHVSVRRQAPFVLAHLRVRAEARIAEGFRGVGTYRIGTQRVHVPLIEDVALDRAFLRELHRPRHLALPLNDLSTGSVSMSAG